MAKASFAATVRRRMRNALMEVRNRYLNTVWGMNIAPGCAVSFTCKLDKSNPRGIHIGRDTALSFGSAVLAHDFVRRLYVDTRIGERCQIGAHSLIMPGITIGDSCIVAAGSVVIRDVPSGSLVFGNPARVMESGLVLGKWGTILSRDSKSADAPTPAAAITG